ncbi:hypothetical protein BCV69DRAFT_20764 [Microstroma glucosiphilum]|uniref:F-box domain-containing protein n=1 Tax=Pseudomicrostroma glucosiphilum TaxID=1684307 RepID=A0A316UIG4_9BASI|nr:hypothetical protein BCV69DRAFT_20764 [Pseudomicrostroma glucosiphilum]PWN24121.1 hypothetical protein BCV69DRAFT_20764 [Pseudomicrostroma glucosiphilum]
MATMSIQELPSELLVFIFLNLDPLSAIKCRAVCKDWEALGKSNLFMRALCQHERFLAPGQTLSSLRKPKRRPRGSYLSWSHTHSQGQLKGLRLKDMASYDVFFKNKWQIQNAWPPSRVPAELSPSISAPGSTEVEATLDAAVKDPKLETSTSSLPSKTTDRPSLLKMYSTSLRPGTFFPGTACFDRAEECLVTSIKNESGLAVIDALTGSVLSFYRRSAAGRPAGAQLWLSEGWIVYATGHKELLVSSTLY